MKPRKVTLPLLVLASALFSTGCALKQRVEVVRPPAARLTCAVEPPVPAESTDAAVAGYIVALVEAGRSCRSQLQWVREWVEKLSKTGAD